MNGTLARCPSCEGIGWFEDEVTADVVDCDWCGGGGYVLRREDGTDQRIPPSEWARLAGAIEPLEQQRLREMGYTGRARKPWEQPIREGTRGGENPYERDT